MFVYLDESGDTGFKFRRGSSKYFVVTLLLVEDPIPIQVAIDELRRELGFPPGTEFKFSHSSNDVRERFLRILRRQEVWIRALIIDKEAKSLAGVNDPEPFYHFVVRLILDHDEGSITDATLVLDESVKSKKSKKILGTYLRRELNQNANAPKVKTIVHHKSHTDNLIQAADMACGAIHRKYLRDEDRFYRLIRPRIQDEWFWQPQTP